MKRFFVLSLLAASLATVTKTQAQEDKSKRPSPPATVSATATGGNKISIDYSQPSVKGRAIGNEIAPYGKVWRTGANEATVFEVTKSSKIDGKPVPAGKYGLYSIPGQNEWTFIFNKVWDQWGTEYDEAQDALRVKVKPGKAPGFTEKMTFSIGKDGKVTLLWGDVSASFKVS